jgi:adenine-specific DNA-methyltransferase
MLERKANYREVLPVDYTDYTKEELIAILQRRDKVSRYGLRWEQAEIAQEKSLNRDFVGFEFDKEQSTGDGPFNNLIVEGDNFDALRHLATTHAGQFKLIYIDPPYNTGNKDFVYNDSYFDATNRYKHSTWLEFMYHRLTLAKPLLAEDGAIVVSIDDNELFNLGLLMNQVFGESSFVASCIWQKRYSRENRESIGDAHEYLLVYAPDTDKFKKRRGKLPLSFEQAKVYKNPENPSETDPAKRWRGIPMTAQGFRPNQMYKITSPSGREYFPPEGRCWSMIEPEFLKLKSQNKIYWGKDGTAQPSVIRYLSEVEGLVPWTWWPHEEVGHTDEARKEVQEIFGTQTAFDTPKPTRLLKRVLAICAPEKDALVLDFFAGSGTFAQAVLALNKDDEGNRRFVLVSSTEATAEQPTKNLCRDVCAVRVRSAINGYQGTKGSVEGLGGDFAYMRAKRVPMHRLETALTDSMVWNFALQACGHPIKEVGKGFTASLKGEHLVCYCANVKAATLVKLKETIEAHGGMAVVFSWAPGVVSEYLRDLMHKVRLFSVPDDMVRSFKQGNVRQQQEQIEVEPQQ